MEIATTASLAVLGLFVLFSSCAFGIYSIREGEPRAARLALGAGVLASLALFLASVMPLGVRLVALGVIAAVGIMGVALFLSPIGRVDRGNDVPRRRFDERDIMFARARLVPPSTRPTIPSVPRTRQATTKPAPCLVCYRPTPPKLSRWPLPRPRPASP